MNTQNELQRHAARCRAVYPPGTRVMLMEMGDDPLPIEAGTRGTVETVDDIGTVHCRFDNGRCLGLIPGEDAFRKLTAEELAEEQSGDMNEVDGPVMEM